MKVKFTSENVLWLFISSILFIYGIIIFSAGIYYWRVKMPETALSNLNPSLWWGALLMVVGFLFGVLSFRGAKKQQRKVQQ